MRAGQVAKPARYYGQEVLDLSTAREISLVISGVGDPGLDNETRFSSGRILWKSIEYRSIEAPHQQTISPLPIILARLYRLFSLEESEVSLMFDFLLRSRIPRNLK